MIYQDFDKLLSQLSEQYHAAKAQAAHFRQRVAEFNEAEEIQKAIRERDDLRRHALLILTDKEREDLHAFREEHYRLHRPRGSTYVYTITGTGIGTAISIKCPICGAEKDVTDYKSW